MSKREAFLEAACQENVDQFLQFIKLHKDKTEPFDVEEVVQELPRDQREALWARLASLLQHFMDKLPPEQWGDARAEVRDEGMEVEPAVNLKHVMAVVDGITLVASLSVKVLQDGDTYDALVEVANKLHAVLVSLPVSEAPLQHHIHLLCEAWWKKGLEEREEFGRTAFLIALQKSFILKKAGSELQRLWSLRDVLLNLDHTSEANKQIKDLLLQCFQRPIFMRNDDGKRFLVFLFTWNVDFIWLIHCTIKNQLQFYSKTATAHIAEIYFRAWKKVSGEFLEQIEDRCIQDIMQSAILLHRSSPVHSKVRQIMRYFHTRKGCTSVEKMLHTLYRPILWRALNAPNFEVRANATLLFAEAFPLHDPSQSNQDIDEKVQKQLDTAMNLLEDPHPTVRSNATLGVCKILAKCWELLPAAIITDFLKKIVTDLANDSSSADVRCSVFKCLPIVLDNVHSHPLLEKLLPTLKYSLHDSSEKVRVAFVELLIKVKASRAAKFWDICGVEHLFARLAIDSQPVSKRIVDLLFKSFLPVNESEREWCGRCITLIQMNPAAARKFYQHVYKHTAPTNIIKMMLAIRCILNSCIQSDPDESEMKDTNKENSLGEAVEFGKDVAVISGLLEVLVILWRSVEKALKQNEEVQRYTFAKFGSVMSKYFRAFEDERCTVPLVQLASFMPPAAVPTFSCGVLSRLKRLEPKAEPAQYSQLLDCMCSWGKAADVLEVVTDWLTEAVLGCGKKPTAAKAGQSKRKVQIQEEAEAKPDLALVYVEYLFSHTSTREKVLALGPGPLGQLHTALGNWKSVLNAHLSSTADDLTPGSETALKAFTLHSRLASHLQHNASEGRDSLLSLEQQAAWVAERVLPFLSKASDSGGEDLEKSQSLASEITESFLTLCRDVLLVGLADEAFKGHILQLCSRTLLSETGCRYIPAMLPILREVAATYLPDDSRQDEEDQEDPTTVILGVVANIFQKMIELLARHFKKEPEKAQQLCQAAVPGLSDFLKVAQMWDTAPLNGVFSTVFAIMIVEKRYRMEKITNPEELIIPETAEELPPLSNILLSVILESSAVSRAFLNEAILSLESEAISSLFEYAAILHILAVVKQKGLCKADLKRAAMSVQQQLHRHAVPCSDSSDLQGVLYESSVKTVNGILNLESLT